MVRASSSRRRVGRGFTLIELIVVIGIMGILLVSLIGGYGNMQKAQRLGNAGEKVLSTLHLARSLAIANNAIYHVRIQNWDATYPDPYTEQLISVYCYPKASDAILVTTDATAQQVHDKYGFPNNTTPPNPWNPSSALGVLDTTTGERPQAYANYSVTRVRMDPQTFLGVQGPDEESPVSPSPKIIQFFPDGTIRFPSCGGSWGMYVIFVTDQVAFTGSAATPQNDFREKDVATTEANLARRLAHEGVSGSSHIRMIRLLQGGSIKLVDPKVQVEHLKKLP